MPGLTKVCFKTAKKNIGPPLAARNSGNSWDAMPVRGVR